MFEDHDYTSCQGCKEYNQDQDTHEPFDLFLSFCPQHLRLSKAVNLTASLMVAEYHDGAEKTDKNRLKAISERVASHALTEVSAYQACFIPHRHHLI